MIHDQVATGSGVVTSPKVAASATRNRTSEITQTTVVGAFRNSSLHALCGLGPASKPRQHAW